MLSMAFGGRIAERRGRGEGRKSVGQFLVMTGLPVMK
jgi:hypothetical protein